MLRVIVLFLFIFTSLFSEDAEEFPFIGVTVTTQSIDIQNTENQNETVGGLRYGRQTVDWRTMFTYQYGSSGYRSFSMEIDKILMDELFGMPEFRPYFGISVGVLSYDNDTLNDSNGYFYGANLGLIIYTTDTIDADLSYHYHKVQSFDGIDHLQGGTLGFHYFY
ncbi:MAG TPA: hypothetical protein ENK39_09390 [Epsilonproteobacteria bacterium]|nr:hypothetical protein [Campylobacterota bacterium]